MRSIAIGDVHGCLDELNDLLRLLSIGADDYVLFVGDLIDRGPDPLGVVRRVREAGWSCLLGNHEEKAARWRRYEARRALSGLANPMPPSAPERLAEWSALTEDDLRWIAGLPVRLQLAPEWIAVHGGFESGKSLDRQDPKVMIRCRHLNGLGRMVPLNDDYSEPLGSTFWTETWRGPGSVVYGHSVGSLAEPRVDECTSSAGHLRCLGIDTGCVFGGRLTAAVFVDGSFSEFVQVRARRAYAALGA